MFHTATPASSFPRLASSARPSPPRSAPPAASLSIPDLADLAHNKPLLAATVAAAVGQLSKPLTSGRFRPRDLLRSGGMPSTHSASVAAAATSVGLQRGFSDPVFGAAVVFVAIVMYDAQGVRREVGYHAKILNKLLKMKENSATYQVEECFDDNQLGASSSLLHSQYKKDDFSTLYPDSYSSKGTALTSSRSGAMPSLRIDGEELSEEMYTFSDPLNESVGHTEIQVIVGAFLGFIVSLVVDTIL